MDDKDKRVPRITVRGNGKFYIDDVPEEQWPAVEAALMGGSAWMRMGDGVIETRPAFIKPPDPVQDDEMLPYWRHASPAEKARYQPTMLDIEPLPFGFGASIIISHLCAFWYTPESYKAQAETLMSFGFVPMRSPRAENGTYYEIWFLLGLWASKGDLRDQFTQTELYAYGDLRAVLDKALRYIASRVSFGTLDVCVQRMCTPNPE